MASNRIRLVRGTTDIYEIDIVDEDGVPIEAALLMDAVATFTLRTAPNAMTDVLVFTSPDLTHLLIDGAVLRLTFASEDTAALDTGEYTYQVSLTLATGYELDVIQWSPFDLTLGGTSAPTPPTFENTVQLDHNYELSDNLRYMTAGGSPIPNAQVRVYYKTDYDAGELTTPVGITLTDAYGRWQNPVLVTPGFSYTVQFLKPNEFGPDKVEVVV